MMQSTRTLTNGLKSINARSIGTLATPETIFFKPYSPHRYRLLPQLQAANAIYHKQNGNQIVNNLLRPLLSRHGLDQEYDVCLTFRQYEVGPDERLVESNGEVAVWQCRDLFLGRKIAPVAWCLDQGSFVPYQYQFVASEAISDTSTSLERQPAFLQETQETLQKYGLGSVLGLKATSIREESTVAEKLSDIVNAVSQLANVGPSTAKPSTWLQSEVPKAVTH